MSTPTLHFMAAIACTTLAAAPLRLGTPFCDGAILQQGRPVAVWGTAEAPGTIEVRFAGQTVSARADASGRWNTTLAAMTASAEPRSLTVVAGSYSVTLRDVLVGEVWLCAGQSNMEWPLEQTHDAATEIASADFPLIRQLTLATGPDDRPREWASGTWTPCRPNTAGAFMGAAYHFAREIHRALGVPVGLVKVAVGGTPIEAWVGAAAIRGDPLATAAWERWHRMQDAPPERIARSRPHVLYNAFIHPLQPMSLAGALWYQGEANVGRPHEYASWLRTLIAQWRGDFARPELPFLIVQLPSYEPQAEAAPRSWAELRAAQARVADSLAHAHLAITLDLGERDNIHPVNKHAVGRRLALLALDHLYARNVVSSGPVLARMEAEESRLRLHFGCADGLAIVGDADADFEIAGVDGNFFPATAAVDGESIVLHAARVSRPRAVRYAWRNFVTAFVVNRAGLPTAPFHRELADRPAER
jgi:sialate O-acetylesterase